MAIITTVKVFFSKVLSFGKPSDDDVLYSKVIKKEIPKESAEELILKRSKRQSHTSFMMMKQHLKKSLNFPEVHLLHNR